MLGISREKLAKIARCEEIGRLLNSTICNNKRWITRKSFQLFLNAQNVYHITDDGDRQEESQVLQEKETLSLMVKEYISSGTGRSECINSYQMDAVRRIPVYRSRKGSEDS